MESIKTGGTLPVPLNIIPTPKSIFYIFETIFMKIKRQKKDSHENNENGIDNLPSHAYGKVPLNFFFNFSVKNFLRIIFKLTEPKEKEWR